MFAFLLGLLLGVTRKVVSKRIAIAFALTGILTFWLLYQLLDMKKHFFVPDYLAGRERSWLTSLYTSVLAQSNAMPDTVPKSNLARTLFMAQVSMGWMWFLVFS